MHRTFKTVGAATGLAIALGLGAASHAAAATVIITADHLASTSYKTVLGGTVDGAAFTPTTVYESPQVFTVSIDGGPSETMLAFCVDIFHHFPEGDVPLTYETASVTHNSHALLSGEGFGLSSLVSSEIGYLADIGQHTTNAARLAGIQGAIWRIEYPGLTLNGSHGSTFVDHYMAIAANWGADHPDVTTFSHGFYAVDGSTQGMVIGAPEPAAWGLMLLGFGLLGGAMRRRRTAAQPSAV